MEIYLLTFVLTVCAFLAIGVNIFFRKGGKFPETEVGRNRKMKELGLTCPKCDDLKLQKEHRTSLENKIVPSGLRIDTSFKK